MNVAHYKDREQTLIKHKLLQRYLSAAIPIVGSWTDDLYFVDCLAGPWKSTDPGLSDTSFAVAIETLRRCKPILASRGRHPTMRCLFIELEKEPFAQLSRFCDKVSDIDVAAKNWDFEKSINKIVTSVTKRKNSFPFFFIDPKGWECAAIPLIKPILEIQPGEVIINLMTSWISRFLSDPAKPFSKLLGSEVGRIARLKGDEREQELVKCYAEAVRKAGGFAYVCTMPVLKFRDESFHFHMIYATRNAKGVEEFKKAERDVVPMMHEVRADVQHRKNFEATRQYSFLEPSDTYQDMRYARYRRANLELAAEAVNKRLSKQSGPILFDELWAEWMQFACVQDNDLQDWLIEQLHAQAIVLSNYPTRAHKLTRNKGIRVARSPMHGLSQ